MLIFHICVNIINLLYILYSVYYIDDLMPTLPKHYDRRYTLIQIHISWIGIDVLMVTIVVL